MRLYGDIEQSSEKWAADEPRPRRAGMAAWPPMGAAGDRGGEVRSYFPDRCRVCPQPSAEHRRGRHLDSPSPQGLGVNSHRVSVEHA